MTAIGGFLAIFAAAGWGSYKEKKLPATPMLFRWFIAGILSSGLASYAWLFGAGGDPTKILEKLGDSLEVKEIAETLTSAVSGVTAAGKEIAAEAANAASELTVGMPTF